MQTYDIVVIGGGPSGIVAATTAKKQHPERSVLLITREAKGMVPCGIPYVFHALGDPEKNTMSPGALSTVGGHVLTASVTGIDPASRTLTMDSGESVAFDKLVFATGSRPAEPTFLPGHNLPEGVAYVPKSYAGITALKQRTDDAHRIVILGSGFTAVELAEQLAEDPAKEIHLVYRAAHCLHRTFSTDFAAKIDAVLARTRVHLHPQSQVAAITGDGGRADGIQIDDGTRFPADLVVVAMGYQAETALAKKAGLDVNSHGQIVVDNYLETNADGIYAIGDCAQTTCFLTGKTACTMLASTATAEARLLAYNLYGLRIKRTFPGTLSVFSTELNGVAFSSAGLNSETARAARIDTVTGTFEDVDRHPGTLADTSPLAARLTVLRSSGQIVGGELMGSKAVGEMINTVALAIQKHVTVYELLSCQIGTHPLLTTAPTKPVLIKAAEETLPEIGLKSAS